MRESTAEIIEETLMEAEGRQAESVARSLRQKAENMRRISDEARLFLGDALAPVAEQAEELIDAAEAFDEVGSVRFEAIAESNVGGMAYVGQKGSAVVDLRKGVDGDGTVDADFLRGVAAHERRHEEQAMASRDILETDAMLHAEKEVPGSINDVSAEYRAIVARTLSVYTERQVEDIAMGRATEVAFATAA